jgi:HD-GYP domain-containing protein (c-di-GMP phosphodiesterase class II)
MCAPLTIRDRVLGVVYVDNRMEAGTFSPADLELFGAIASSAAGAVENAKLYEDMERAYESTLEGWARALELRDHETQGHTRRVSDMTVTLAKAMGVNGQELAHIRRGALVHDIGKMGIPDAILLKPGVLEPHEREKMQEHPRYALDMLWPIAFLRPALAIPYCHHERWDGRGYPNGLVGTDIPVEARMFAVVDVWDALRSDRPYHTAQPEDEVRRIISENAGTHFDPEVVGAFLETCAGEVSR